MRTDDVGRYSAKENKGAPTYSTRFAIAYIRGITYISATDLLSQLKSEGAKGRVAAMATDFHEARLMDEKREEQGIGLRIETVVTCRRLRN